MTDVLRFTVHGATYADLRQAAIEEVRRLLDFPDPLEHLPSHVDFQIDADDRSPQNGYGERQMPLYEARVTLRVSYRTEDEA